MPCATTVYKFDGTGVVVVPAQSIGDLLTISAPQVESAHYSCSRPRGRAGCWRDRGRNPRNVQGWDIVAVRQRRYFSDRRPGACHALASVRLACAYPMRSCANSFGRLSATQWPARISSGVMCRRSATSRRRKSGGKKRSSVHHGPERGFHAPHARDPAGIGRPLQLRGLYVSVWLMWCAGHAVWRVPGGQRRWPTAANEVLPPAVRASWDGRSRSGRTAWSTRRFSPTPR